MSLSEQLKRIVAEGAARATNNGCRTCQWLDVLDVKDREAFLDWVKSGRSLSQLWDIVGKHDPPYPVSLSALRQHVKQHVFGA